MDINIIISGNLTGFSRFYATPNANELYADAKFDFDYRNFVTFLNNGEKAYVISFAPNVVSVSLITRILDSFRRPGILVVSTLLQKGMIVDSLMNPGNKNALYQFLNEINDKFYERNFMNGMINQNAAVLMQDYYSDILSNYRLTSEYNQRKINGNIDITTPNKRLGYIAANDIDMPLYLSSLYRRSYEGFHHVFFAANAPQNIEETPEEVAMYRVYITNNRMTLPAMVKLTDQIYRLNPGEGEIPFDQNYTYGEVLEGKAGSQIRASIVGETLEVSYRFKEEEKTINFIFEDRGNIIPLASIAPVIHDTDGTSYNLSSDTFKFIGKEIYGKKILKSTNTNFIIKPESSTLDLLRLNNGATCHVQVESCFVLNYKFQIPYNVPKKITIYRKDTNQSYTITDVTDSIYKEIPGNLNEWDYIIESKEYITLTGNLEDLQSIKFSPKPISNTSIRTTLPATGSTQQLVFNSNQFKKGSIKLSNGSDTKKGQSENRKLNIKKVLLVAMPLFVILLYVGISWQFNIWPWNGEKNEEVVVTEEPKSLTKVCTVKLKDCTNDYLLDNVDYTDMRSSEPDEDIKVEVDDNIESEDIRDENTIKYKFIALENCNSDIHFKVTFDGIEVCDSVIQFNNLKDNQDINLKLNVRTSGIVLFKKLYNVKDKLTDNDWTKLKNGYSKYKGLIKKDINTDDSYNSFNEKLKELYKKVEKNYAPKNEEEKSHHDPQATPIIRTELETLSKLDCTFDEIKAIKKLLNKDKRLNEKIDDTTTAKKRIEALEGCIETLRNGYNEEWDPSHNNLSNEQAKFIIDIIKNKLETLNKLGKKGTFKNIQSLADFRNIIQKRGLITKDSQWYNPNL